MAHIIVFLCPEHLGNNNGKTAAHSIEPSCYKKHQRTGASNGCQRIYADKLTGNNRVCNIIKLLKHIAKEHWYHKPDDQLHRVPYCHIACHIFFHNFSLKKGPL